MRLSQLMAIAPPPKDPVRARGDWEEVEGQLGLRLPEDFKALIATYGLGSFADFLNPIHPFREGESGFAWADRNILEFDREMRAEFPEDVPFPIHPEPGGLLPWATTDNGDTLYWLTEGDPEAWTVVVHDRGLLRYLRYPFGAVEFLWRCLSGELICPIFPKRDRHFDWGFSPYRDIQTVTVHFAHAEGAYQERLDRLMGYLGATKVKKQLEGSQCVFQVDPSGSTVTYTELGDGYGAWLALGFPPEDEGRFKELVRGISERLGWPIRRIRGTEGNHWDDVPRASEPGEPQ